MDNKKIAKDQIEELGSDEAYELEKEENLNLLIKILALNIFIFILILIPSMVPPFDQSLTVSETINSLFFFFIWLISLWVFCAILCKYIEKNVELNN